VTPDGFEVAHVRSPRHSIVEFNVRWSAGSSFNLQLAMSDLVITYQSPAVLKPRKSNPRTHSKAQLKQIADSIRTFGFTNPVLVDENNRLIAGHGRIEAAIQLGIARVPTVCLAGMTEAQIRA
jgi:hypothetical protein